MAILYVRSTDGSNSDNGSTWALAKLGLGGSGAPFASSAGDTIYVSQAHAETGGAGSISVNGSASGPTNPLKIIGANDGAEPPTALSTAPTVTVSNGFVLNLNSGTIWWYGLNFIAASGASATNFQCGASGGGQSQTFNSCVFDIQASSTASIVQCFHRVVFKNCSFLFANNSQGIACGTGSYIVDGGGITGGQPTPVFKSSGSNLTINLLVTGFDFSNCASGVNLWNPTGVIEGKATFRNCRLPTSWNGGLVSTAPPQPGVFAEMINCAATGITYAYRKEMYAGQVLHNISQTMSGGATTKSGTAYCLTMTTNANASYPMMPLESPEMMKWNTVTGTSVIATVEIANNGTTLTDQEVYLRLWYMSASGNPIASVIDDCKADFLATAVAQTTSSVTWNSVPGTPVKQSLSVTFTPNLAGFVFAQVCLTRASKTIYVNPQLTLT